MTHFVDEKRANNCYYYFRETINFNLLSYRNLIKLYSSPILKPVLHFKLLYVLHNLFSIYEKSFDYSWRE